MAEINWGNKPKAFDEPSMGGNLSGQKEWPSPAKPAFTEVVEPGTSLVPSQPAPALPTQEISPEALDELFQRDPREITDQEFEAMVLHYRSQRGRFVQAEKDAAAQGKKQTRMPKQTGPKAPVNVSLGDLNLGALLPNLTVKP